MASGMVLVEAQGRDIHGSRPFTLTRTPGVAQALDNDIVQFLSALFLHPSHASIKYPLVAMALETVACHLVYFFACIALHAGGNGNVATVQNS